MFGVYLTLFILFDNVISRIVFIGVTLRYPNLFKRIQYALVRVFYSLHIELASLLQLLPYP